jgi:chromate transporter
LWWLPVALAALWGGKESVLFQQGVFFSKAALVTFGGAYAVLPYVSQQAVETFGWLSGHQMLDGLAFAESTPGPLIIVLEFVGFLGAWKQHGTLPPLVSATLGALMTLWCTVVPCFLWRFVGAPYIERMQESRKMNAALSAVSSVVVGVILNLALWFGRGVLWPDNANLDWVALGIFTAALAALWRFRWGAFPVVVSAGCLGVLCRLIL